MYESNITIFDHNGRKLCAQGCVYNSYNNNYCFELKIIIPYYGNYTHEQKINMLNEKIIEKYQNKKIKISIVQWLNK